MKYWEMIAYFDGNGRKMICADAHRGDGKRIVVHAEDASVAFAELEAECQTLGIPPILRIGRHC